MNQITPEKLYEQLKKIQEPKGFYFNPEQQITLEILKELIEIKSRYGYMACPCRLSSGNREKDSDIFCPCDYRADDVEEFGRCYCGLYVSREYFEGKILPAAIPERRPVARILA